jgi:hypothetical protein
LTPKSSFMVTVILYVYYESIKREVNIRLIYECRCDERLKAKTEGSTRLGYTGWRGGLEHLKKDRDEVDRRQVCECDG